MEENDHKQRLESLFTDIFNQMCLRVITDKSDFKPDDETAVGSYIKELQEKPYLHFVAEV